MKTAGAPDQISAPTPRCHLRELLPPLPCPALSQRLTGAVAAAAAPSSRLGRERGAVTKLWPGADRADALGHWAEPTCRGLGPKISPLLFLHFPNF
jgi:hypothetical protein